MTVDTERQLFNANRHLLAVLAAVFPSEIRSAHAKGPGWSELRITTPTGWTLPWHVHPDDRELFSHVPEGRTPTEVNVVAVPSEKYQRLRELVHYLAS